VSGVTKVVKRLRGDRTGGAVCRHSKKKGIKNQKSNVCKSKGILTGKEAQWDFNWHENRGNWTHSCRVFQK